MKASILAPLLGRSGTVRRSPVQASVPTEMPQPVVLPDWCGDGVNRPVDFETRAGADERTAGGDCDRRCGTIAGVNLSSPPPAAGNLTHRESCPCHSPFAEPIPVGHTAYRCFTGPPGRM
ncbi:hypothetical protein KCMC57_up20370 [Kitasatospora sp. CMC57]|uniref:Uncharacterized protein n=1 Tax=Kitasatospora sp. CMC57 TaxID=3231513 RepID=A0AB33JSP0_9ACTN